MDINTCFETTNAYHTVAFYAHFVPIALALFLSSYALIKTRASRLAIGFFAFTLGFSLWLLGDVVTWTSSSYNLVYFTWSWLDFVNVVFFTLGAYFFAILARGKMTLWEKCVLILLWIPALYLTATDQSLIDMYQPACEATENELITIYKAFAEWVVVALMFVSYALSWKTADRRKRVHTGIVLAAILLFFGIFSSTEYIATTTNVYEINLYGLFVLPLFLIVMTFATTNLGIFEFRLLGTQILAYALIIMTGSQLLFIQDSTQLTLSVITVAISLVFGVLLLQNAQKEEQARHTIERLAGELERANGRQVTLIHFITHQIKGYVSKSRNIFSMMLDGDYGQLPAEMKHLAEEGLRSDTQGVTTIQDILNAANIKSGKVSYTMAAFDLKALIEEIVGTLRKNADAKGLTLNVRTGSEPISFTGDRAQLLNAFKNLIDNSIKYTPKGEVDVSLAKDDSKVTFEIKDTGVGISPEDMKNLFTEGGHGKDSAKINVESTGFGLYIVKGIIEAHKGKVWAESEGCDKGSRFIVELPTN